MNKRLLRQHTPFTSWFAMGLMLCLVYQALLPTFSYLRSATNPVLWTEICSAYGNRTVQVDRTDLPTKNNAPALHAECPLCLHLVSDIILGNTKLAPRFDLIFVQKINVISFVSVDSSSQPYRPEARAPPSFS